ncbi:tRNA (cytidine(34)-2'-O)-methyltransferase [Planctomyces sp. SH-PL14]|uniref:tRNA (cytidine(34)-2'-O)-methyltransferase n=1 Tax=Planctomyces sp. SH-PL14 TaxID=1632864 RepID=UPI00078D7D83|nr:tRNA (cytidine(34)-2'-O)-methyltransferase [Planctomyces sp. SH-PL14]AMV17215.1 Putative tRNA (cytidine(34)-2'-O)-methyltransferase [Planctomyces sp. SH-PL14]
MPSFHVVLYCPEIPQNAGNVGRTCVAAGAKLWLVRPLGFHLDDRYLKRAGMDYWQYLDWEAVNTWDELETRLAGRPMWFLTKFAERLAWDATFQKEDVLVFGSESRGLPESLRSRHPDRCLKLPMDERARSLNLASTVNTIVYEGLRQTR